MKKLLTITAVLVIGLAASAQAKPRFGVTPSAWSKETMTLSDLNRLHDMGATEVRTGISWRQVSTGPGTYDWSDVDARMTKVASSGLDVELTLAGTARYALDPKYGPNQPPMTAGAKAGWVSFVRAAAARYGRWGTFWRDNPTLRVPRELWLVGNEENTGRWGTTPNPGKYAELLHLSAAAVHAVAPQANVATGGVIGPTGLSFIKNVFAAYRAHGWPLRDFFAVGVHPYAGTAEQSLHILATFRAYLATVDRSKRLNVDEISWGSVPGGHRPWSTTETGQARQMRVLFDGIKANPSLGVYSVLWYGWRDTIASPWYLSNAGGMFRSDGIAKPAASVFWNEVQ